MSDEPAGPLSTEPTRTAGAPDAPPSAQSTHNAGVWARGSYVAHYDHQALSPPEVIILARWSEALSGRVLDAGCGAGRLLGYLVLLGGEVHGLDISPEMVAYCRRRFPAAEIHQGDLGDLRATDTGPYDAIVMADCVIDVFGAAERRAVLVALRSLLAPGGLLIFSSHNLDGYDTFAEPRGRRAARVVAYARDVARGADGSRLRTALGPLVGLVNRRRLAPLQVRDGDHALINDSAHHYGLLHYYVGSVAQREELAVLGFEVAEVREADGRLVPENAAGTSSWLYYVARSAGAAGPPAAGPSLG